jgi:ech hydrogenase subunit A
MNQIMNQTTLLALLVLSPVGAGLLCYLLRWRPLRIAIVLFEGALLAACAFWLFKEGNFNLNLPEPIEEKARIAVTICELALLLYFLFVGIQRKHLLTIIFALAQLIPVTILDLSWGHAPGARPTFFCDHLSIVMVMIIDVVGSLIIIYAVSYMDDHEKHLKLTRSRQPSFFLWMLVFLGAMNGLVLSNDLLWVYFCWEVTTFCCYQLIRHDRDELSEKNALRALWMNLGGGVAFVAAIILMGLRVHSLGLSDLTASNVAGALGLLPVCLLCLSGFTKAAQVPFQSWLLGAMVAPTPVSALLHSSTMVKAGVYLVLRMSGAFAGTMFSTMVAVFGAFVLVATSVAALMRTNAKSVLAYSTIGNLGLIILCAGINTKLSLTAAVLLIIFHAVSKGLLFMSVGAIESRIGSREIEDMDGLLDRYPWLTVVTTMGALSMLAPPFGVLMSKWAALEAVPGMGARTAALPVALLLICGSAVTIVFWVKWIGRMLSTRPVTEDLHTEKLSFFYHLPLGVLLIGIVALAALISPLMKMLVLPSIPTVTIAAAAGVSAEMARFGTQVGGFSTWPMLVVLAVFLVIPAVMLHGRKRDVHTAYMCGENVGDLPQFYSLADTKQELRFGGFYFGQVKTEGKIMTWSTVVGVLLLVVSFWVAQ